MTIQELKSTFGGTPTPFTDPFGCPFPIGATGAGGSGEGDPDGTFNGECFPVTETSAF